MIAIVSPSKTMKEEKSKTRTTSPKFIFETDILSEELKRYSISDLEKLMGISEELALLNYERFQNYSHAKEYPALFLFRGDVFRGIDADTLTPDEIQYLNKHLRILSGFYGVLKPLDRMKPYRLEMGTKLKNIRGKDLYSFWGDQIKEFLEKEAKDQILVNLASKEYAKAAKLHEIQLNVYDIEFREKKTEHIRSLLFTLKLHGAKWPGSWRRTRSTRLIS